jgi:formylglycine-generating enzyme required for sulfatase activity
MFYEAVACFLVGIRDDKIFPVTIFAVDGMVLIPAGSFQIGTAAEAVDELMARYGVRHRDLFSAEVPRHTVRLAPFYLDSAPVTNARFAQFLAAKPEWSPGKIAPRFHNGHYLRHWVDGQYPPDLAGHPVVFVSWYAAMAFARWAGGRLPSEAEWEAAALGGRMQAEFPWGDEPPGSHLARYAAPGTAAVGSYPPNPYGLYDLAGNVWEFCLDEWQADFYARSPVDNPLAGNLSLFNDGWQSFTSRRVIRGGSWGGSSINLRCAYRDSHPPIGAGDHVGFRCARDA